MIQTTAKYKEILKNPRHWKETRLNISGVDYMEADIISASIHKTGIFSTFDIGNCVSRELDIEILPKGTIPRQAKIQAFVRLVLDSDFSEWIPQGTFFIKHREKDKATGALSITAFDSMLKTDEVWLNEQYDLENWPMPQTDAVSDIAYRIGVEVDQRTVLSDKFPVDYPVDENGDMTMREVLSGIAISNAGNWVITLEGKLLLLKISDLPPETNYLINEDGDSITLGGVRIIVG
jgi:hypothetical protein